MSDDVTFPDTGLLTVPEVAEKMGLSVRRVQQFVQSGRLKAKKIGRQWFIQRSEYLIFASRPRPVGRPPENGSDS